MEKQNKFRPGMKQTMLAKPQDLTDSDVKNSEEEMLFSVFSGNELREFEEKWQMLKSTKIVKIQAFNLKPLLRGCKRDFR